MGELGEGVDLFDYLLEYLVAEGYADTNKAALVIMANMSEEWRQSIIENTNTVLSQKGGVPGTVEVKKTKEGGFFGIGGKTVSKPVPGTFKPKPPSSKDAARYNNELDKKYSSDGQTDSTKALEIQKRAREDKHSGYMKVKDPNSIPNTGLPNKPTPQRAADQNFARKLYGLK